MHNFTFTSQLVKRDSFRDSLASGLSNTLSPNFCKLFISYQFDQLFSPLNAVLKSSVDIWGINGLLTGITAPFNNMRTLKFKAQPTNAFFATVNQMFAGSSQLSTAAERAVIKSLCRVQTTNRVRQ